MTPKINVHNLWLVIILGTLAVPTLHAVEAKENPRLVTVQGQGKVQAVPDVATLWVEVSLEGTSLDALSAQVRERMQKALDILKAQGIEEKDIQTLAYQVQPRFDYDRAGNSKPKGFRVANRVAAKVHDLKKVGKVLSAVVDAGVTSVNGPDFDFNNPQALERQALAKAVEDAKAKAGILAQSAGAVLGEVMTITQNSSPNWPGPRPMMMARTMMASAPPAEEPIVAGQQDFTSNVTVTFALK